LRAETSGRSLTAVRLSLASVADSEMRALVGGSGARLAPRRVLPGLVVLGVLLVCLLVFTRSWPE